ncbi:hypothetical protein FOXYSP1_01446 [Fusarium oxysporum f. sp. phaseoli]
MTTRHGKLSMFVVCVSHACAKCLIFTTPSKDMLLNVIALGNNHRRKEKGPNRRRVQVASCRARLQVRLSVMKHSGLKEVEVDGMDGDY